MSELEQIIAAIDKAQSSREGRHNWKPERSGTIDIRIAADGNWYHEGRPFQRQTLVKLFANVLCREGSDYFLLTPAEKLRIQVDDAPFVAMLVDSVTENGQTAIVFTTNLDERIVVDLDHPIRVEVDPKTREPRPYVYYRDGCEALISRRAFFDLAGLARETVRNGKACLTVSSLGEEFELGCLDPEETA